MVILPQKIIFNMKVEKFKEANTPVNPLLGDKIFTEYSKPIRQMVIDRYNIEGYKLYYYSDFKIIEIADLSNARSTSHNNVWLKKWGNMIFFLNEKQHALAVEKTDKCKELYDAYIKQAESVALLPESAIYYDILQVDSRWAQTGFVKP
jgi:predicted DNA-binding protein YlxM (UPF0122 family)